MRILLPANIRSWYAFYKFSFHSYCWQLTDSNMGQVTSGVNRKTTPKSADHIRLYRSASHFWPAIVKASRRPEQNVRKASGKHGSDSYWYFPALESDNVLIRNPYVPPCQTKERIRNKEHMYRSKTLKASQEQICNKKWQTSLLKCEAYWCTNALLTWDWHMWCGKENHKN